MLIKTKCWLAYEIKVTGLFTGYLTNVCFKIYYYIFAATANKQQYADNLKNNIKCVLNITITFTNSYVKFE